MPSPSSMGLQLLSQQCFVYPLSVFGESIPTCFPLWRILSYLYTLTIKWQKLPNLSTFLFSSLRKAQCTVFINFNTAINTLYKAEFTSYIKCIYFHQWHSFSYYGLQPTQFKQHCHLGSNKIISTTYKTRNQLPIIHLSSLLSKNR